MTDIHHEDTFNPEQSEKYHLILQLQADCCAFALYDLQDNSFVLFQEIKYSRKRSPLENLKEIFSSHPFLALPYRKVQVLTAEPGFTLVPAILFDEKNAEKFYDFNFHLRSGICLSTALLQSAVYVVFETGKDVYEFLSRSLKLPEFVHPVAPLASFFQERSKIGGNYKMVINLHPEAIDMVCYSSDEFILANCFLCSSVDDIIYYILFAWKQLQLNQLTDAIYVVETDSRTEAVLDRLRRHLKNVHPFSFADEAQRAGIDNLSTIPSDISSLILCEL